MRINNKRNHHLSTDRIVLKLWDANDLDFIFSLRSDKAVNKYLDRECPNSKDDVVKIIDTMIEGMIVKWYSWVILDQESENKVGSICLWNFSNDMKIAEIGYEIASKYQKQGFASESIQVAVKYAFEHLNFSKLIANVVKSNIASINVLLKNNFIFSKTSKSDGVTMNTYELVNS